MALTLTLMPGRFAVVRLTAGASIPGWFQAGIFSSITRSPDELSVTCDEALVPDGLTCERGFRIFKFEGPFEFDAVGILVQAAAPLAEAKIPIMAISSYDTDYLMVKQARLADAIQVLQAHAVKVILSQ